ncbi:Hypothetical_protein [Hexamita inflata]|uniref:Hypothetical_protein n=1 Tax=Hexamita inflata TaxID=28002 RepID=A0AA86URI8_9EUKA|nr:Hypothetical protein HINF_LOCUS56475 [Hexamita inflata]
MRNHLVVQPFSEEQRDSCIKYHLRTAKSRAQQLSLSVPSDFKQVMHLKAFRSSIPSLKCPSLIITQLSFMDWFVLLHFASHFSSTGQLFSSLNNFNLSYLNSKFKLTLDLNTFRSVFILNEPFIIQFIQNFNTFKKSFKGNRIYNHYKQIVEWKTFPFICSAKQSIIQMEEIYQIRPVERLFANLMLMNKTNFVKCHDVFVVQKQLFTEEVEAFEMHKEKQISHNGKKLIYQRNETNELEKDINSQINSKLNQLENEHLQNEPNKQQNNNLMDKQITLNQNNIQTHQTTNNIESTYEAYQEFAEKFRNLRNNKETIRIQNEQLNEIQRKVAETDFKQQNAEIILDEINKLILKVEKLNKYTMNINKMKLLAGRPMFLILWNAFANEIQKLPLFVTEEIEYKTQPLRQIDEYKLQMIRKPVVITKQKVNAEHRKYILPKIDLNLLQLYLEYI